MVYRNTIAGISKSGHFLETAIDSQRLLYGTIAKGAYVPITVIYDTNLNHSFITFQINLNENEYEGIARIQASYCLSLFETKPDL